jgi:hypothetical protein
VESVPYYLQDLAFKLIKMNDLNWSNWNLTDTVQEVKKFLAKSGKKF